MSTMVKNSNVPRWPAVASIWCGSCACRAAEGTCGLDGRWALDWWNPRTSRATAREAQPPTRPAPRSRSSRRRRWWENTSRVSRRDPAAPCTPRSSETSAYSIHAMLSRCRKSNKLPLDWFSEFFHHVWMVQPNLSQRSHTRSQSQGKSTVYQQCERQCAFIHVYKHFFSNRVVEAWNSLPAEPCHFSSLSTFIIFLKKVWICQSLCISRMIT